MLTREQNNFTTSLTIFVQFVNVNKFVASVSIALQPLGKFTTDLQKMEFFYVQIQTNLRMNSCVRRVCAVYSLCTNSNASSLELPPSMRSSSHKIGRDRPNTVWQTAIVYSGHGDAHWMSLWKLAHLNLNYFGVENQT